MGRPTPGLPVDWWPIDPIHVAPTTTGIQFITRAGRLYGWSFEESTGSAAAKLELVDGTSTGGLIIVSITLLANESTRDIWGKPGIRVQNGVFLNMVSGSARANIYYLGMTDDEIARQAGYQLAE
jgi:hypothetical protein